MWPSSASARAFPDDAAAAVDVEAEDEGREREREVGREERSWSAEGVDMDVAPRETGHLTDG